MPEVIRPDGGVVTYEVEGQGDPVLLLAPKGLSSANKEWQRYFVDPRQLADDFMVIGMDQRHAGSGRSPLAPFSHEQAIGDQLAVIDALGLKQVAVIAADFYCASALKLACDAPARTRAVVLIEPMGLDGTNKIGGYYEMFNETIRIARAEGLDGVITAAKKNPIFADNPAAGPFSQRLHDEPGFQAALRSLSREGYIALVVDFRDGVFPWGKPYFSVNEHAVNGTVTPMLLIPGDDERHPAGLAGRIAQSAADAQVSENRQNTDELMDEIRAFLARTENLA